MDPRSAASAYKLDAIESAPPIKLVRLLYQTAMRHLDAAAQCDPKSPDSPFIDELSRVDAIVTELRLALNAEVAPEISESLEQLYLFIESCLQAAMRDRDASGLRGARDVLKTLLEAWTQVEVDDRSNTRGAA